MKSSMWMFAVVATLTGGGFAQADGISFDSDLAAPGFYNGSGNPNGGFTIDTNGTVEVGLRARLRQNPTVINSSNNVYVVPSGAQPGSPSNAAWNYDFSINLQAGGVGSGLTLSDISAMLTITDVTKGVTSTPVNVLTYFGDDAGYNGSVHQNGLVTGDFGAQNSENPNFASFPLNGAGLPPYVYNEGGPEIYSFELDVTNVHTGVLLASDTIQVDVTPLPSSVWGGLALLGCLGVITGIKRVRRPLAV